MNTTTDIKFKTTRNGQVRAYRWSGRQMRWFPIGHDEAKVMIATGQARDTTEAQTVTGRDITEGMTVRHNNLGSPVEVVGEVEWDSASTRYIDGGRRMFTVIGPRGAVHALCVRLDEAVEVAR